MADFRKWFLVLAIVAAFVIPANAQVTCGFNVSPTTVRAEGLSELAGDILLTCAGPQPAVTTSITAFFTATVTSLPETGDGTVLGQTASRLTVFNGTTPSPTPSVVGIQSGNSLAFNGVVIPATPAGTTTTIRITNVRINANQAGAGNSVFAFVAVNPVNSVFFSNNPNGPVASVQTGLTFTADTKGDFAAPASLKQCVTTGGATVNLNFAEGFSGAFKTQLQEGSDAANATLLFARFTNIPTGVTIGVPTTITTGGTTPTGTATLIGFDPTTAKPATLPKAATIGGIAGLIPVTIASNTGAAVYRVDTSDTGVKETFILPVTIAVSAGVQPTTSASLPTVGGGLAPVTTSSTVIPRFVDVSSSDTTNLFTVAACVTNLLFPFVTNQAGFDTGIALVNSSLDNSGNKTPFNTTPQSGACTVFFFNGTTTAPAPQTTASIPAGGMAAFTLQGGGVAGSTSSAAGFQGYIIATCNFQFAHGFAFISDRNTPSLGSQGYLALVIPDRGATGRLAENFTVGSGTGEQLAQ